ncbi:MAG: GNAT family N-acetyltransferase [Candidatus Bathyarchaeia archaeon]
MLLTPVKEAVNSFERRLIVLTGEEGENIGTKLIEEYCSLKKNEVNALYVGDNFEENTSSFKRFVKFKCLMEKLKEFKLQNTSFKESLNVLGLTFDLLILDLNENLTPNDIGVLIEVVKGGGLILFLTPKLSDWESCITTFHKKLVVLPEDYIRLRHIFVKWFIKKLKESKGVWIYDPPNIYGEALQPSEIKKTTNIEIDENIIFPKQLYELCVTQDQIQALSSFEKLLDRKGKKALVMIADRGRGKSSLLGLSAAGLLFKLGAKKPLFITFTAPSQSNLATALQFVKIAFEKLNVKIKEFKVNNEISTLKCKYGVIEVLSPYKALSSRGKIAFIDEAAGIPVPLLFKFLRKFRTVVFSSTIHGYEGAGRGFSLRFLKALEENKSIETIKVELKTPIRYSINDPIEKWLYNTLLLNAEPPQISLPIDLNKVFYEKPNLEEWFSLNEKPLREFVGICILAHYRNRPNDFAMLADAPHHQARVLKLSSGEIITVLHLAEEGGLPDELIDKIAEGEDIPGVVIPSCIIKHYTPLKFFAKQKGLRIVRIAVHPELERKGLGSKALKNLIDESEALGYDWIGAVFGATIPLLSFWLKNGFTPIHLSPSRNIVSGEYSVVVIKPLTRRALKLTLTLNQEFKLKLLNSLFTTYFTLDPKLARLLFKGVEEPKLFKPKLTKVQEKRLLMYSKEVLTFESAADAIKALLDAHFMSSDSSRIEVTPEVEAALIAKCLQGKSWSLTAKLSLINREEIKAILRENIKKMVSYYVKD